MISFSKGFKVKFWS